MEGNEIKDLPNDTGVGGGAAAGGAGGGGGGGGGGGASAPLGGNAAAMMAALAAVPIAEQTYTEPNFTRDAGFKGWERLKSKSWSEKLGKDVFYYHLRDGAPVPHGLRDLLDDRRSLFFDEKLPIGWLKGQAKGDGKKYYFHVLNGEVTYGWPAKGGARRVRRRKNTKRRNRKSRSRRQSRSRR